MKTVKVSASAPYGVNIGGGILKEAASFVEKKDAVTAVVVSDDVVFPLYGNALVSALGSAGFETLFFVFPHGEESKNGETYLELLGFLADAGVTRSDIIFALGGGVVGDLAGFAAATFMRGIRYVGVPTTLLAAVDSSVGGKCAIDLPGGKNLAGAFHQPSAVVCDTDTLRTLEPDTFSDGCAEALKYGVICDPDLFRHISDHGVLFDRDYVISRCVEIKADIVARDERDQGVRALLNLGHTFGHGIEAASGYTVTHGKAVAVGMATAARGAEARGLSEPGCAEAISRALGALGLPDRLPDAVALGDVLRAMRSDKKRRGGKTTVVVPEKIGKCALVPMTDGELFDFFSAGM
ncbi:MAG: 3-dehydroquinate synthase [Clostridia bacterium]|nr:3-dehydroquinate synthase [Clostridia bacterium]